MAGREATVIWEGRKARAWIPATLAQRELPLSEETVRRTERAAALVRRGGESLPEGWEGLARLLLRTEGIASSFIEGIRAPLEEVAAAELDPTAGVAASAVADNVAAVRTAIGEAQGTALTRSAMDRWHATLMARTSHLPTRLIGARRDVQGWIGGTSPLDAAFVPPPPDHVARLLDDLVRFVNRGDINAITQAAVAHAQFEVIHPYADGNGRIGRVLIGWILARRLAVVSPPPVSVRIAADRGGYLSGLTLFRLGDVDHWVRWFADTVEEAGQSWLDLVQAVGALQARWAAVLSTVRSDAAARRALSLLTQHPVLDASTMASTLGISERTGRAALQTLASHGIVVPFEPPTRRRGRPRRWWMAPELVELVAAWSR